MKKYRYQLERTETERKQGRYLYQIRDTVTGEIVSQRRTDRIYQAAAAPYGNQYFGRPGLARKWQDREAARMREVCADPVRLAWWERNSPGTAYKTRPEDYPVAVLVGLVPPVVSPMDMPVGDMPSE